MPLKQNIRREHEAIVCCARKVMNAESCRRMHSLLADKIDWDYLLATAMDHKVMPLLYKNLCHHGGNAVPALVMRQLHKQFYANAANNLFLVGKLLAIIDLFATHGIVAVAYKGPVLAAILYQEIIWRQFLDLDILLPKQHVLHAQQLLLDCGCLPEITLNQGQKKIFLRAGHDFTCSDERTVVDLNWATIPGKKPLAMEQLWQRLVPISLDGREVLTLASQDLLLLLCEHGAKHLWSRLGWICDLAEFSRRFTGSEWRDIIDTATITGNKRELLLGMTVAGQVLQAPLVNDIEREIKADTRVAQLSSEVHRRLFAEPPSHLQYSLFRINSIEQRKDRFRARILLLLSPTEEDFALLTLPAYLSCLYYPLRSLRLFGKYALKLSASILLQAKRFGSRQRYPPGLLVVILGTDGAGKSSVIAKIAAKRPQVFARVSTLHFRPRVGMKQNQAQPVSFPHRQSPRSWCSSVLKLFYYLVDYIVGYWWYIRPQLTNSTLVLFDRYYCDLLVDSRRYRYGGPAKLVKLLAKFIPTPDVVLVLDASVECLLARKQEISAEELQRQRKKYQEVALGLDNSYILDASLPIEQVVDNAISLLMAHCHSRRRRANSSKNRDKTLHCLHAIFSNDHDLTTFARSRPVSFSTKKRCARKIISFGWLRVQQGRDILFSLASRSISLRGLKLFNAQSLTARLGKTLLQLNLMLGTGCGVAKVNLLMPNRSARELEALWLPAYLSALLGKTDFSVCLGVDGPCRKAVLQFVNKKQQTPPLYVKIGWDTSTKALLTTEVATLRKLHGATLGFHIPQLVSSGEWQGRHYCVISSAPEPTTNAPQTWDSRYMNVVSDLAAVHTRYLPLKQSRFWQKIVYNGKSYHAQILHQGINKLEKYWGNKKLPFHLSHGDFCPWNALLVNKSLFVFDWERADLEAPAGYDLFHFLWQTTSHLRGKNSAWALWQEQNARLNDKIIENYLQSLGQQTHVEALWGLYLLKQLSLCATSQSSSMWRNLCLLLQTLEL